MKELEKKEKLYEGKAKAIYSTNDPDIYIQHFKDDATAFDGKKKGTIKNKGSLNCRISSRIFEYLEGKGVKTHYVEQISDNEMAVKKLDIYQVEVVLRNIAAGSLSRRMGVPEGAPLSETIVELYYKSDELGDPMINEYHAKAFGLASPEEIKEMQVAGLEVNRRLVEFFKERGLILVDFKLEFGSHKGEILLGDEITPDGCRLWDLETREKMDKDRFRQDLGGVEEAYEVVARKVME